MKKKPSEWGNPGLNKKTYGRNNQISESRWPKMVFSHANCGNFLLYIVWGEWVQDLLTESDKPWCKNFAMLPSKCATVHHYEKHAICF